jgi:hypothetical protein
MSTVEYRYENAQRLLPDEIRNHLSREATALYVRMWNLAAKKVTNEVWVSDKAASVMSRIDVDLLSQARGEVEQVGLWEIKFGIWPQDDPPNICHRYKFLPEAVESEPTQD